MDIDRDALIQSVLVLPALWPEGLEVVQWWFAMQPPGSRFGLSVDARAQRVTFWGWGELDSHVSVVSEFLDGGNSGALARSRWERSVAAVGPGQVGTWLELSQRRASGGWFIPGPICAQTACATVERSMGRAIVMNWFADHGISQVVRWACSSFGSRLSTEFVAVVANPSSPGRPCPFRSARSWLSNGESSASHDAFRHAMTGIHVVLGADGPVRVNRVISSPTVDHAVAVATLASGFSASLMVDLQGRLGQEPSELVVGTTDAEYYYELSEWRP